MINSHVDHLRFAAAPRPPLLFPLAYTLASRVKYRIPPRLFVLFLPSSSSQSLTTTRASNRLVSNAVCDTTREEYQPLGSSRGECFPSGETKVARSPRVDPRGTFSNDQRKRPDCPRKFLLIARSRRGDGEAGRALVPDSLAAIFLRHFSTSSADPPRKPQPETRPVSRLSGDSPRLSSWFRLRATPRSRAGITLTASD